MFTTDPSVMINHIRASIQARNNHLQRFETIVDMYDLDSDKCGPTPENVVATMVAVYISRLVSGTPRAIVTPVRQGPARNRALLVMHAFNAWSRARPPIKQVRKFATDYLLQFGCLLVDAVGDGAGDEEGDDRRTMRWRRLHPKAVGWDHLAETVEDARYVFHEEIADKEDLLARADSDDPEDDGWDRDAIESLETKSIDTDTRGEHQPGDAERDEVSYYEVWVKEATWDPDDFGGSDKPEFNGMIYTISASGDDKGVSIREPRPAFCPPCGRYVIAGQYEMTNKPFYNTVLSQNKVLIDALNRAAGKLIESIEKYKRAIGIPLAGKEIIEQLIAGEFENWVIPMDGAADAKPFEIEVGGPTDQLIRSWQILKGMVEEMIGIDSAMKGDVTSGGSTATEHSIAAEGASVRAAGIETPFVESIAQAIKISMHYIIFDKSVVVPLDSTAAAQYWSDSKDDAILAMDSPEVTVEDEDEDSEEQEAVLTTDRIDILLEPGSMGRANEARRRQELAMMNDLFMQIAQAMGQMPWVDWPEWLSALGDRLNFPNMGQYVDFDAAKEIFGEQFMMSQQDAVSMFPNSTGPRLTMPGQGEGVNGVMNASGGGFGPPVQTNNQFEAARQQEQTR